MNFTEQKLSLLLLVFFSPVLIVILHIIFSRIALLIKSRRPPQFICFIALLFANVPFFLLLFLLSLSYPPVGQGLPSVNLASSFIYAFIVFNLICYTYFHIYNMSETARRVRILYDIYSRGSITKSDIEKSYHSSDMVAVRLERLLGLGQVRVVDGAYIIDGRLLYYGAVVLAFWSRMIGLSIMPEGYKKNR